MKAQYYKINLNKASNRLDQFEQARKVKKIVSLGVFFLLLLAGMGFVFYKTSQVQKVIDGQKAELQAIQEKIDQLEASTDYLSPEDLYTLSHAARGRMSWSENLAKLGDILPKDVAVTELIYEGNMKTFTVRGVSKVKAGMKDLDLVVSIIDLMKAEPQFSSNFSEIKFQSSQRIKHGDQEIVKFEIACLLKA